MMTTTAKASLAVFKPPQTTPTPIAEKVLVISCGYANNGKFGYFICNEHMDDAGNFCYSDQYEFYPKVNDHTYAAVLAKYNEIVLNK
jgi:hypothetical protein